MASIYTFSEYDPKWPEAFAEEKKRLLQILGEELIEVHHIGSTSVPGLAAKPILDLLPIARDIHRINEKKIVLVKAGYHAWGEYGLSGRSYFTKDRGNNRTHNIHMYQKGHPDIERHLAFSAYLRAHPAAQTAYVDVKHRAYALHPSDVHAYNDAKDDWIKRTEKVATQWYREMGRNLAG